MKKFYIDYTGDSLGNKEVKFHGGGDFSRFILWKLDNEIKGKQRYEIVLLWPNGVNIDSLSVEEKQIRTSFAYKDITSITDVEYEEGDILFLPLLDCLSVRKIGAVKSVCPNLKVKGVLHGTRLLDVSRYDKYDKYYYDGLRANPIYLWSRRWLAALVAKVVMKKYLPLADNIYTVSNSSMQKINEIARVKYLKFFYRNITQVPGAIGITKDTSGERFALFINSNRYEKNFIRSLIAFCRYKESSTDDLKLYVLGASDLLKRNIARIKEINQNVVKEWVCFLGYVEADALKRLYSNCEFLLYTSKSEGYGLPPMEVMAAGRPSVASSTTSVPEVLGMGAYYVDPYDINSIKNGIQFMADRNNQRVYTDRFKELSSALFLRGDHDINTLVTELIM